MSGVAIVSFNRAVTLLGSGAATAIIALLPAVAALPRHPGPGRSAGPGRSPIDRPHRRRRDPGREAEHALHLSTRRYSQGDLHDPPLLPPDAQSGESRAPPRGDRPRLRDDPGRHEQGRTARTSLPRRQPQRKGAGDRRHGWARRSRSPCLRFERDPPLPRREGRQAPRHAGGPARAALLAPVHRVRARARSPARPCTSSSRRPKGWTTRATATGAKPRGTTKSSTSIWPGATGSSATATQSPTSRAWGWLDRASRVLKGEAEPLAAYPNLKRLFAAVDARPAAARARAIGQDHEFKKVNDEETRRALFPSNYQPAARPVQESPS